MQAKNNLNFLIDSHCHLNMLRDEKGLNIDDVINRSNQNSVNIINNIGTHISEFDSILELSNQYDNVYAKHILIGRLVKACIRCVVPFYENVNGCVLICSNLLLLAFQYVIAMAYTPEGGDVGQHCNDGNRNSQPHYVGHNATYNGTEGGEHNALRTLHQSYLTFNV